MRLAEIIPLHAAPGCYVTARILWGRRGCGLVLVAAFACSKIVDLNYLTDCTVCEVIRSTKLAMRLCARSPSSRPPSPDPSLSPSTRTHHPRRARPSHHAHDERIASTKCALGRSGQLPHQLAASVYLDWSPGRSGPKRLGSERCSTALTAPSLAEAFAAVPHPRQGRCLSTLVRCAPASSLPASHSPPELLTFASARHPLPPSGCSGCAKPLPVSPSRRQRALRTRPNSRTP